MIRNILNSYILTPLSKLNQIIWKTYVPKISMKFQYEENDKDLLPKFATDGSVGLDLAARESITIPCNTYFKENQSILRDILALNFIQNSDVRLDKINSLSIAIENLIELNQYPVTLIPLNIKSEYPKNMWGLLASRGGLSIKRGLIQSNAIGVIDVDFVKEHKLPLINITNKDIVIEKGERIAQLILIPWVQITPKNGTVTDHDLHNGFHSTGKK